MKTALSVTCLVVLAPTLVFANESPEGLTGEVDQGALSVGVTLTATVEPGTAHVWSISTTSEQYGVVEVVQQSSDVIVRVITPGGVERSMVDRTDVPDSEVVRWISDESGTWKVTVTPFAGDGDPGNYAITLLESHAATERERQLVEADGLSNRALLLEEEQLFGDAEELHRRALTLYEAVYGGDAVELLETLADLGRVIERQGEFADAEPVYRKALEITIKARGATHPDVGNAEMELARLYLDAARYPEAQAMMEQALDTLTAALGSQNNRVSGVLSDLGRVHFRQGNYELAESYYEQAIAILEAIQIDGDPQLAVTLNNLAVLYKAQARYQEARELYERMIDINTAAYGPEHIQVAIGQNNLARLLEISTRRDEAEPLYRRSLSTHLMVYGPNHRNVGYILLGLAGLLDVQSRYAEAEELYRHTLELLESVLPPGHPDIAAPLLGLAHVYQRQGRVSPAETLYLRALELYETSLGEEHWLVATALGDLAVLYLETGDYASADSSIERAQAIEEALFGPDHPEVAREVRARAMSYDRQGRFAESVPLWSRALKIFEARLGPDHPDVASALIGSALAQFRAELIKADSAIELADRAIEIYEAAPGWHHAGRVSAYVARARLRKEQGDLEGAIEDLDEALLWVDEQRSQVGGDEEARARFFEGYAPLFSQMVSWQIEIGDTVSAFEFAERGRARVLLDQLAAGKIDIRSSIPPETRVKLEQREADAKARLAEYQQRITLLRSRADLSAADRGARIAVLEESLRLADQEYRQVYADIKSASPLWRDEITSGGRPASLRDIQRTVVPRDGLLLSYQIGPGESFVFVIPPRGRDLEVFALEVAEDAASTLGVEAGPLTAGVLQTILAGDSEAQRVGLFRDLSVSVRGVKLAGGGQAPSPEPRLHALWQVLMPASVWSSVESATEVVIVPDGALHYLPFEALVTDPERREVGFTYWLDAGPPIRYAASATALTNITRRPSARVAPGAAGPMMLSVSNPKFDPGRVTSAGEDAERDAAGEVNDSTSRGGAWLAQLPGTADETEAVRESFGAGAATRLEVLSGLEATESNLRASVAGKRYLHFATHGLVDQQRGILFASLALTPPSGETADHENDGFWHLHEIYEQRLSEVELAVLSACESNVGQRVEGEGVFALSRGFSAAGAQRVVASQWAVDDASTAALIGGFFRQVITADTEGRQVDYAVALRDAKLAVRGQAQWSDPYFWAPFVLTGKQ